MLCLSQTILNQPVMSLRTGGRIATVERPIINPNNLKIEGLYVNDAYNGKQLILVAQDVRDIINQGVVVNDHEVLEEAGELVRLKEILDINYAILGKPVYEVSGGRVGRVADFAFDSSSLFIQKIYAAQNLIKSFSGSGLSIDRSQIHEITNHRIIINDLTKDSRVRAGAPAPA